MSAYRRRLCTGGASGGRDPDSPRTASSPWGNISYFHWMWAIRSTSLSNSSEESDVQKRAILHEISRRAEAIASAFLRSSIGHWFSFGVKLDARCKNCPAESG